MAAISVIVGSVRKLKDILKSQALMRGLTPKMVTLIGESLMNGEKKELSRAEQKKKIHAMAKEIVPFLVSESVDDVQKVLRVLNSWNKSRELMK